MTACRWCCLPILLMLGVVACRRPTAAPPSTTPIHSVVARCPARALEPSYLPDGAEEVELDPYIAGDWWRTWEILDRFIEVTGGVPSTTTFVARQRDEVRGHLAEIGRLAEQSEEGGAVPVATWTERGDCGQWRYAVSSNVLSTEEVVKIAKGLRTAG